MESKVNYVLVGLFVLFLSTTAIVAGLWLASDIRFTRYHPYVTYFDESVAGLNPNAPVKYRGVNVGRVDRIELDPENPTRVRVLMDIASGTPIRTDTYAILRLQGLTGIAFVELEGGEAGESLPSPMPDGSIPVIVSKASPYNHLEESLGKAALTISEVGERLARVLDQKMIESLHRTLHNLEQVTAMLNRDKKRFDVILANGERFSTDLVQAGESLPLLVKKANRLIGDYDRLSQEISTAAAAVIRLGNSLEQTTGDAGRDLHAMVRVLETEIRSLSGEVADTAREIRALARRLNDNPNVLIYGNPQPSPGPGE